ncbi:tetratricopeptide repeat protein [Lewinella sp. W8]|uniref:tetratricopeptide repeat protein n=1 Tax=Lewinella sp. W8 TaxID=2528208 RepID=UPI0010681A42|nr:tetratricopeptide repeat protein [Lewinella sp. W8]MTB52184.1 tetratricopeptide repeat protein [Lewinella sp. W8]
MKPFIFLFAFTLIYSGLFAQLALEPGFAMLEAGEVAEAETFFGEVLRKEPDNLTANICYGRAVGLNGRADVAVDRFKKLREVHPENLEVALNLAEAFMWKKDYGTAVTHYEELIASHPDNFTAILGGANAQASVRNYPQAWHLIGRALHLRPRHESALRSRKFILFGRAGKAKEDWNYRAAHRILDSLELLYPGELNTLLIRGDVLLAEQKIGAAARHFSTMVADSTALDRAYGGLSYTSMLKRQKKQAIKFARLALEHHQGDDVSPQLQLVNALGFAGRFREAFALLDSLESTTEALEKVRLARARMLLWSREIRDSKGLYDSLLLATKPDFDLLMGAADAQRANHELDRAIDLLTEARNLRPESPDAFRVWRQLLQEDRPTVALGANMLEDNGGNRGLGKNARITFARYGKFRPHFGVDQWEAQSINGDGPPADQLTIEAGGRYRVNATTEARISGGVTNFAVADSLRQSVLRGEAGVNFRLGKYHSLDVAASRDLHNYTASLVRAGILRNHLTATYNFSSQGPLGLYAQYIRTAQSDGNQRSLLFLSLYWQVMESPWLKVGLNYNQFGFKEQVPSLYFSPRAARGAEIFLQLNSDKAPGKRFFFDLLLAAGNQRVEENAAEMAVRGNLDLGFRPTQTLELLAQASVGNTVQSVASGYAYQRFGLALRYHLPVTKKQKNGLDRSKTE